MPNLTVGHWTFTDHFCYMSDHLFILSDKMSARKRNSSVALESVAKQRQVTVSTFGKWQRVYDREHQTRMWLKCEKDSKNRSLVSTLWCHVCRQYRTQDLFNENYSNAWISGSQNQRTTNVLEHATIKPL